MHPSRAAVVVSALQLLATLTLHAPVEALYDTLDVGTGCMGWSDAVRCSGHGCRVWRWGVRWWGGGCGGGREAGREGGREGGKE